MTALATRCPNCDGDMAGTVRFHCERPAGVKPCHWVKHECNPSVVATIEPRTGRYFTMPRARA